MRSIAVFGNCQIEGFGAALRALQQQFKIVEIRNHQVEYLFGSARDFLTYLKSHDVVMAHWQDAELFGLSPGDIFAEIPTALRIPVINFQAFHPDCLYAYVSEHPHTPLKSRHTLASALGGYTSALMLAGYLGGLSSEQTLHLFREDVMERLGYFDFWEPARAGVAQEGAACGIDLDSALVRWSRTGCFMHLMNHPKFHVFLDIAKLYLRKAGIGCVDLALDATLDDPMAIMGRWPVYPAVGTRLGIEGDYRFERGSLVEKYVIRFGLREVVENSFALFQAHPKNHIRCARVRAWLDDWGDFFPGVSAEV